MSPLSPPLPPLIPQENLLYSGHNNIDFSHELVEQFNEQSEKVELIDLNKIEQRVIRKSLQCFLLEDNPVQQKEDSAPIHKTLLQFLEVAELADEHHDDLRKLIEFWKL